MSLFSLRFNRISFRVAAALKRQQFRCGVNRWYSHSSKGYRVLFFGTDNVSLKTLHALYMNYKGEDGCERVVDHLEVVCPEEQHEPGPVRKYALKAGLTIHHPNHPTTLKNWFPSFCDSQQPLIDNNTATAVASTESRHPFDIGVIVSFRYLIPARIVQCFNVGAVNMHPSMLPKYRGAAPIYHTLLNGDSETAVCVIEVHPTQFDKGRILSKATVPVGDTEVYPELENRLATLGASQVLHTLRNYDSLSAATEPQSSEGVSHAGKVNRSMAHIDFERDSALTIYNKWRAFYNSYTVFVYYENEMFYFRELLRPTLSSPAIPTEAIGAAEVLAPPAGTVFFDRDTAVLYIRCADGEWLGCTKLQKKGRRIITALDFANANAMKRNVLYPGFWGRSNLSPAPEASPRN